MAPLTSLTSQFILALCCLPTSTFAGCIPTCKAYPGGADWPSPGTWNKLNDDLGGRLLQPPPPGAVCHPGQPTYDAVQCPAVVEGWRTYDFHAANPVSVMWDNWSNDTCLPNASYPCSPAGYPAFVINATTAEHVKHGVDFARKHNVRLVVKSTGHDFLGRSISPGSLSIWVHHLNHTKYHDGEFKLKGCKTKIPGSALTVGGGTSSYTAYLAAGEHNQTVVAGTARSVGIVGHSSAGGHSILSSHYGLGADQILQIEVVTPSGEILTVNECKHPDLFWALRGGGGSTFGVVTAVTIKTYPSPKMAQVPFLMYIPPNEHFWDVAAYAVSQFPALGDAGLSGYFFISPVGTPNDTFSTGIFGGTALIKHDTTEVDAIFESINKTVQQRWPGGPFVVPTPPKLYDSFLDWYAENYDQATAGGNAMLASRLLGRETLDGDLDALSHAMKAAGSEGVFQAYIVAGKGTADAKPRGGSNSVHPAWRTAYLHTLVGRGFPPFNKTAEQETIDGILKDFQPLRDLTPGGGSYLNEAFKWEPNFHEAFWGTNYDRLLKIKKKVDPSDVFWCQPCVGNEKWAERDDGRLCRT